MQAQATIRIADQTVRNAQGLALLLVLVVLLISERGGVPIG